MLVGIPVAFLVPGFRLLLIPVAALVILGIVIYNMARAMPVKTHLGAEEAAKWLAFRRDLADIRRYEGDVAAVKGIFERYLPYATAFGLEQHWVQTFKRANPPAPPRGGGACPPDGPRHAPLDPQQPPTATGIARGAGPGRRPRTARC